MKLLWQQIPSTIITEILCNSNFDGLVFDLEHGLFNDESLYASIQVASLYNKKTFVRVCSLDDKNKIRMSLDCGISGIILSTVENYAQAKEFFDYCTYPFKKYENEFKKDKIGVIRKISTKKTEGKRGHGLVRENLWGLKDFSLRSPILIPQIETKTGVDNINSIKLLDFDYFLVGPYDLSASLGCVGDFKNETFLKYINLIEKAVGDKIGFHIPSKIESQYPNYKNYPLLALGMDSTLLIDSLNKICNLIK